MKMYDLDYKFNDNNNYYYLVIDLVASDYFMVKNPSCTASVEHYLSDTYNIPMGWVTSRFKIIFNGNLESIDIKRVPKKYHRYIKKEDLNV